MSQRIAALGLVLAAATTLWAEDVYAIGVGVARTVLEAQLAAYVDAQGFLIGCL